ncbi:MAG: right-handed parallel beta-helix repeat-containing protein [Methanomassiliicoccus sp.]|nr:right-handed parallel beta-helix repeat-containing protein [Methanomassiliicoccus sp.]
MSVKALRIKVPRHLIALLIVTMMLALTPGPVQGGGPNEEASLTVHDIIRVESDDELAALRPAGDVSGSGTAADPYVIESYRINATGHGYAVFVANTTAHLVIRDCWFYGASRIDERRDPGAGIVLVNAPNVIIENNTCSENLFGIYVLSSYGIFVSNNDLIDNEYAVGLISSSFNVISGNECVSGRDSISLQGSDNNTMLRNECRSFGDGIRLVNSAGNMIRENVLSDGFAGIALLIADRNTMEENTCTGNIYGINVERSSNCTMLANQLGANEQNGAYQVDSHHNSFIGNNCTGSNNSGISVFRSTFTTLENNDCSHNGGYGINLGSAHNGIVAGNDCSGNGEDGINMGESAFSILRDNVCSFNMGAGIETWDADDNLFFDNLFENNGRQGMFMYYSDRNTFSGNVFIGNSGTTSIRSLDAQAFDHNGNWWNSTRGNYWADWAGPDSDKDGVVDESYLVGSNNVDGVRDLRPIAIDVEAISSSLGYFGGWHATVSGMAAGPRGISTLSWHNQATDASGVCSGFDAWTATIPLELGENIVMFTLTDRVGNVAVDELTVILDSIAPPLLITSPADGSSVRDDRVVLTWESSAQGVAGYVISIDDGRSIELLLTATGYTFEGLADGAHMVRLSVHDLAGNSREVLVSFTVDTSAPPEPDGSADGGPVSTDPLFLIIPAVAIISAVLLIWWRRR